MKTLVRDSSIEAYYAITEKRLTQYDRVLEALKRVPDATDYEIAEMTGIARHLVPDRRGKLVKRGLVTDAGKRDCRITKFHVHSWKIVYPTTLF